VRNLHGGSQRAVIWRSLSAGGPLSTSRPGSILTSAEELVFTILSAVAEMERERIGERVRSVKQHLRNGGYFTGGKLARGYRLTDDGKLVADERWIECLTAMKQMRQEGLPYRAIADRATADFGMSLDYSTVFRILNNKRELDMSSATSSASHD
jgi:DNA invertase Pin-like site-specific DNA recombinase